MVIEGNAAQRKYQALFGAMDFISADESFISSSELAWACSHFCASVSLKSSYDLAKHFLLIGACTVPGAVVSMGAVHKKSEHLQIGYFAFMRSHCLH